MKKTLALVLALLMALGVLPAMAEAKPVELTILLEGNNVTDDTAVLEQLNAYLTEKIGVTLKPVWGTWSNFNDLAMNAINSGSDEYDMMFTSAWTLNDYSTYAQKGAFVRLDDPDDDLLAQYGTDMMPLLPELLVNGAKTEGPDGEIGIYAVPGFKDFATMNTWDVNVTLLEKYGYTVEDVKNAGFYGWDEMLAKVKAGEEAATGETFYPLVYGGTVVERFVDGTPIVAGDANTLLSYYMNKDDVSQPGPYGNVLLNKFGTEEFKNFVTKSREYYNAGYINPSLAISEISTDTWRNAQNTANYLISSEVSNYGYEFTTSKKRGIEVQYILTTDAPYIDNTSVQGAMMAISANSDHPVECIKFLNLLNSDSYVMTTLGYGLEGVQYDLNDVGEVVFNADGRSYYTPWALGLGNSTLLPPQEGQGADFQHKFAEFYAGSKKLPIYGFTFDPSPVQNEIAAVANIKEAYMRPLCVGAMDPETALPELLQKLDDAGMQKIVDEANAQLEAFLANQQ